MQLAGDFVRLFNDKFFVSGFAFNKMVLRKSVSDGYTLVAGLFLAVLITLSVNSGLYSQPWKFIKEKDGIRVYTRQQENSPVKSFMGVADIKSGYAKIYAIVGDVRGSDRWDENIIELKVLSSEKDKSFCYYLVYSTPWPLQNRDLCVEAIIRKDTVSGDIEIFAQSRPKLMPEQKDLVRIKEYWQKWTVHPIDNTHTRLTIEGTVNPGGSIPAWLANMVITDTPLKMLHDIRERVE
jgi:hypothetical protein